MEKQAKKMKQILSLILIVLLSISCKFQVKTAEEEAGEVQDWKTEIANTVQRFGHRNWIVVADGAYPEQSNPAIKTIAVDANQLEVVTYVNELVAKASHVDANIFVDKEMAFVAVEDAPGIEQYRTELTRLLKGKNVKTQLHEAIISELDTSAKLFNVLIIKTDLAIPYTSVFFQLECGYWNATAEEKLRNAMKP